MRRTTVPQARTAPIVHQACTDSAVTTAAADVLEALLRTDYPSDLNRLAAAAASHKDIGVVIEHYGYGLVVDKPRGIRWELSDGKGVDYDDKVVLLLPPFIKHILRPRWDGKATVILVGDIIPTEAVYLLTALLDRLPSGQ